MAPTQAGTMAFMRSGKAYGPFDLTMLEIGAYNTGWADIHMGPITL